MFPSGGKMSANSNSLVCALLAVTALLATEANAAPQPASCYLTDRERALAVQTKRWMLRDGLPQNVARLGGCAVIEIEVSPEGAVQQARVIRSRAGGSEQGWRSISLRQRYVARGVKWKGLVSFRTVAE